MSVLVTGGASYISSHMV